MGNIKKNNKQKKKNSKNKGQPTAIGDELEIPSHEEVEKRCLDILLVGLGEAGKSMELRKLLGLHAQDNSIQKGQEVPKHKNRQSWNLARDFNEEEHDKGGNLEETGPHFETNRSRYFVLEAESHHSYVPNLISRALQVQIAVFLVPADPNRFTQNSECIKHSAILVTTLDVPKVILLVNLDDNSLMNNLRFKGAEARTKMLLKALKFNMAKTVMYLPIFGESGLNIKAKVAVNICQWWENGPCLYEALDAIEVVPMQLMQSCRTPLRSRLEEWNWVEELVRIDLSIDQNPTDPALWYNRSKVLGDCCFFTEAFESVSKALKYGYYTHSLYKEEDHPVFYIFEGDRHRLEVNFHRARENYIKAQKIFKDKNCNEAHDILQDQICLMEIESLEHMEEKQKKSRVLKTGFDQSTIPQDVSPISEEVNPDLTYDLTCVPQEDNTVESCKKTKQSVTTEFLLEKECQEDNVFSGHKIMSDLNLKLQISVIKCSDCQMKHLKTLLTLGLNNSHVLTISDIANLSIGELCSTFFVVQPLKTVEHYYTTKLENFHKQSNIVGGEYKEKMLTEWWHFIDFGYKRIFRELVDGVLYLCHTGHRYETYMYVTEDGHGKVLPSMNDETNEADLIEGIVKKMKSIVYQPFLGHALEPKWLSNDLVHFFRFVSKEKLKYVPFWWLIDHFLFWTPLERVNFIYKLRRIMPHLKYFKYYMNSGILRDWSNHIPDGVLKEIWKKGTPSSLSDERVTVLKNDGWIRVQGYKSNFDIVRYMVAVYTHYNDDEYSTFRIKTLNVVEIEQKLQDCFPKIYGELFSVLYNCARSGLLELDFKALSRHHGTDDWS